MVRCSHARQAQCGHPRVGRRMAELVQMPVVQPLTPMLPRAGHHPSDLSCSRSRSSGTHTVARCCSAVAGRPPPAGASASAAGDVGNVHSGYCRPVHAGCCRLRGALVLRSEAPHDSMDTLENWSNRDNRHRNGMLVLAVLGGYAMPHLRWSVLGPSCALPVGAYARLHMCRRGPWSPWTGRMLHAPAPPDVVQEQVAWDTHAAMRPRW